MCFVELASPIYATLLCLVYWVLESLHFELDVRPPYPLFAPGVILSSLCAIAQFDSRHRKLYLAAWELLGSGLDKLLLK
jgi:hypothetical protein